MTQSNSLQLPKDWTFWRALGYLTGAVASVVSLAVVVVLYITDLKIASSSQDIPRLSGELNRLDTSLDQLSTTLNILSDKMIFVEGKFVDFERRAIASGERVRDIDKVELELTAVNTKLGAYDERLKSLSITASELAKNVADVDKKIFGTETNSQNVKLIVEKVTTDVESINTEMDSHGDQLEMIADVVKTGFEDDPKVEPLLKHIAKTDQHTTEEIVETIGQLKSEHNNDPVQVSNEMSVELGVDPNTARVAADERLSMHLAPEFFELSPAAAMPLIENDDVSALQSNPFAEIQINADARGESISSLCKRYQSKVALGSCYEYFLQRLSATEIK